MSEKKPEMKRDGTMQVTAKEGVQFLKAVGDEKLLELQGLSTTSKPQSSSRNLSETSSGKPDLSRLNTMQATAKEGERYLKDVWKVGQQDTNDTDEGTHVTTTPKPKLTKFTTMLQTKKEGEAYIGGQGSFDDDVKTRTQQEQLEKILDEPSAKRAKTVNERSDKDKPSTKRVSTIQRTAKEGEELLKELGHKDENPESDSGRRRTRSQTRGVPPPPPPAKRERKNTGSKDGPKSDGTKSRGRGRPKKEEKKEEVVPEEEAPMEDDEEKEDEMDEDDNAKTAEEKKEDAVVEKPAAPAATNPPSTTSVPTPAAQTASAPAAEVATEQKN